MSETTAKSNIKPGSVTKYGEFQRYIIKFSNLIYERDNKEIKIPVFQGTMGDVKYNDFLQYCEDNNILKKGSQESGFIIVTKRGELKKKFHEFLRFYKGNVLKDSDIDRPSKMYVYDGVLEIEYDFLVNSVPMALKITIYTTEDFDTDSIKSVFDINNIDENMKTPEPYFMFTFRPRRTTN
jgi:hypothetical protein